MKLCELLDICYMRIHLVIKDANGMTLTEPNINIDDYFVFDEYRQYDNKKVDYIYACENDISDIPTLIVTIR